ncbi:SDR family NAD(P)-dependent oxidoreductase [Acidiferrimicrobium sp. IK]|uniref:SDR family oxidoreductase n=1 Tax=Acidiferrimicrobium sp. IK TaxID=2871700 RepID=UPI0021CB13A0|nr:SDR family oxidoreductase [Acidiferrimicrobium sp. IK]MCU4187465.1 SDR family NAD(P)-dependent oxidoreductase [Acidiferrimicrobium sp. IK]
MNELEGRVCIVTGAGRGIGREHALAMAAEGAKLVVNDLGGGVDGAGADAGPASEVVEEIRSMGGEAVANTDSVTSWEGAQRLIRCAVDTFGGLDVLVNNAGILRDRFLVNMTEDEWDAVIAVHLKGHFAPARWAAAYWRDKSKEIGGPVGAAVVNTASAAMLGNAGQTNYSAAKAGIAAMTLTMAMELKRYGVRVNAIAPVARTRMTLQTPGLGDTIAPPTDQAKFDIWDPANVSPMVAYLSTKDCPVTGGVFHVGGNEVALFHGWDVPKGGFIVAEDRWAISDLAGAVPKLLDGRSELASVSVGTSSLLGDFGNRKGI